MAPDGLNGYDAVLLAGGAARRMNGEDKALLEVGGRSTLRRVLDAVAEARVVVICGPRRPGVTGVRWVRESPPGGGPVAGLAAGLGEVTAPVVAVLACDLPFVTPQTIVRLTAAAHTSEGAVLVDAAGARQPLCAAYQVAPLRAAVSRLATPRGASMRDLIASLRIAEVAEQAAESLDIDDAEDLARARAVEGRLGHGSGCE